MAKKKSMKIDVKVQEALANLDADIIGVATLDDVKGTPLEKAAKRLLPSVRSIVVMGMEIYPEFLDLTSPERTMGTANLNDLYRRHTEILGGRLTGTSYEIARVSRQAGLKALPLPGRGPSVDGRFLEAVISYKHAGAAAGLGSIGMNSLLVTDKYGPRVQLSLCLTKAVLESTAHETRDYCRSCNICVLKCPAHALEIPKKGETYIINRFACRTYLEGAGGCSECMRACPVASPRYE
jgi:epoxyqueuosine reductase